MVAVHQGCDEGEIAGEVVDLGDGELGRGLAAGGQGLLEFGAIRAFAGLDLGILGDELPGAAIEDPKRTSVGLAQIAFPTVDYG